MDVAFMVYYNEDNTVGGMLILHVDDLLVATDGSAEVEAAVALLHEKYPFGQWSLLHEAKTVTYTGRDVSLVGDEIHLSQQSFVEGRMDLMKIKKEK